MGCCSANKDSMEETCKKEAASKPFKWNPSVNNIQQIAYVRRLEGKYEELQSDYFSLTTKLARLQFRVRQLIRTSPCNSTQLIDELERVVFKEIANEQCSPEELPSADKMGDIPSRQQILINSIRCRIGNLPVTDEEYPCSDDPNQKQKRRHSKCDEGDLSRKPSCAEKKSSQVSVKIREKGGLDTAADNTKSSSLEEFKTDEETDGKQDLFESSSSDKALSFNELRSIYQRKTIEN